MPAICEVENLTFAYKSGEPVIIDANFSIEEREFVAVIGPNGGGKTTLLKLLLGFLKPQKGEIKLEKKKDGASIAYVPQTLFADRAFPITVSELVLTGRLSCLPWWGFYSKADRKKAEEAIEICGLGSIRDATFGQLSGGQTQRALIARAIVSDPDILLLDEPLAHLDSQSEEDLLKLILELKGRRTIMMVTHDIRAIITNVHKVLCVVGRVDLFEPEKLCEHFALGLYHYPLIATAEDHLKRKGAV
jgi:zinc transport system ATP-binding protein